MLAKTKIILIFLCATYAVLGFFATPLVLKSQLKSIVEEELNADISIEEIFFNPFSFRLVIDKLELRDLEQKHLMSFNSLDINIEPSSLYKPALHIKSLLLQRPKISLIYEKDKTINIASMVKGKEKQEKNGKDESFIPRVILEKISIANGCLDYKDYSNDTPFDFSFENIGLNLENIDTKELSTSDATARLYSSLGDGGTLDIKSKLLSLKPLKIEGGVEFHANKLYSVWKYFQDYLNIEVADGEVDLKADYYINLDDLDATTIDNFELFAAKLRVKPKSGEKDILNLENFSLSGVTIKPMLQDLNIENLVIDSLHLRVQREKSGEFDWSDYIKTSFTPSVRESKSKPWSASIDELALKNIKLDFIDQKLEPSVTTRLDVLSFNAYGIDSKESSWLKYGASAKLNGKGDITLLGEFRHTPLKQKSEFKLSDISLKEFSPYLNEISYLELKDGYLDLDSKVEYEKRDDKADLRVSGLLNIKEFFLNDARDSSVVLSLNKMQLNSFEYEMNPDRAYIDELDLDGFYIKAIIDRKKVLNLAGLIKESKEDLNKSDKPKFDFKIMKIDVASGSARFEDLSLPLDFKTDIHNLNGAIYAISNQDSEISYVDIAGEVDRYGSTKLSGSLDSANPKNYLDLNFNFRNLELSALSGYSANFAGYKIDEGKLFLDLGYKIVDSNLLGKNSIIIKKIELGEKIEDENINALPLGFAIALLEDSNGVIDIDMPVEGNVDAPDFKYGSMVLKTFTSLIVRAVASPFKFLGSMVGLDGEKLEYIEFESGLSTLLPPEREKLDNLLKIMLERPKISLKITPKYDEIQDAFLLKREKMLLSIMKKSGVKSKKEQLNSLNIDLLEDLYEDLNPKLKLRDIENSLKERYSGDVLEREYLIELVKQTTRLQELREEELYELATLRGEAIREYLVDNRALQSSRLTIDKAQKLSKSKKNWVKTEMNIEVK